MKRLIVMLPMLLVTSCVLVVGDDDAHFDYEHDYHHVANNAVAERVEDVIYADESIRISDLHVSSKDGVVYLRGKTNNPETVTRAVSLAMADAEVESVTSRIIVNAEKY